VYLAWAAGVGALVATVAQAESAPSPTLPALDTSPTAARVVWLDKQTNTRSTLVLQPGVAQTLGPLAVRLEKCTPNLGDQPNTDAAWLVVSEPGRGTDWFAGWMINTLPEVATLDHPRYDAQLVGCGSQSRQKSGPVAHSSGPPAGGVDLETGADSEADPYYIPGLEAGASPTAVAVSPTAPAAATPIFEETPATPAPPEPTAPAAEAPQQELHQMMEGTY